MYIHPQNTTTLWLTKPAVHHFQVHQFQIFLESLSTFFCLSHLLPLIHCHQKLVLLFFYQQALSGSVSSATQHNYCESCL